MYQISDELFNICTPHYARPELHLLLTSWTSSSTFGCSCSCSAVKYLCLSWMLSSDFFVKIWHFPDLFVCFFKRLHLKNRVKEKAAEKLVGRKGASNCSLRNLHHNIKVDHIFCHAFPDYEAFRPGRMENLHWKAHRVPHPTPTLPFICQHWSKIQHMLCGVLRVC